VGRPRRPMWQPAGCLITNLARSRRVHRPPPPCHRRERGSGALHLEPRAAARRRQGRETHSVSRVAGALPGAVGGGQWGVGKQCNGAVGYARLVLCRRQVDAVAGTLW